MDGRPIIGAALGVGAIVYALLLRRAIDELPSEDPGFGRAGAA
jgi:hypothetical protein